MFGALIGAGASLLGGLLGKSSADSARESQERLAQQNMEMQREFAQNGIRWKAQDALAAGIHPLYALGANTHSFSPVSMPAVTDNSLGSAIAASGQDISRAMNATRTAPEREDAFTKTVQALSLQKMGLENDLLASQVAKIRASTNPPMPAALAPMVPQAEKFEDRPRLALGHGEITTNPNFTNAEDFEKRYGETVSDWVAGPYIAYQDYLMNTGGLTRHARRLARDAAPWLPWRDNFNDRWDAYRSRPLIPYQRK